MELVYKNADMNDVEVLIDIYNSAFHDDYVRYGQCPVYVLTKEDMKNSIKDFPKYIAYYNNNPVGVISFKTEEPGKSSLSAWV